MDEEKLSTFEYFNTDIYLLTLHILLEGFYRGQNRFTLDQFLKGNYWKLEEISDEITDTNDYGSAEDLVWHQVINIIETLSLAKIKKISVNNLRGLLEVIVREAVMTKDPTENEVGLYGSYIEAVYDLRTLQDKKITEEIDRNLIIDYKDMTQNVSFKDTDEASHHLNFISSVAAPFINLELTFIDEVAKQVDKEIDDYMSCFSQDDFIEKKPPYKRKRYYFSKQLENFYHYIKNLPLVDGSINIPFSALEEQGFEVIKILSYLEREKRLKVTNWNDIDMWHIKIKTLPITLAALSGQKDTNSGSETKELKLSLSFSPTTGVMVLKDQDNQEYKVKVQGQVQKEVLRVIFQNPKDTYSEWSLYEISETLGRDDVDEVAVKNAIYQFNRKVKLEIPEAKNLFELTKHSAQLNPNYVSKK